MEQTQIFNIKNDEFLNEFYSAIKKYTFDFFEEISKSINLDKKNYYKHFFSTNEIAVIIVLNKAIFQNVLGFLELCEMRLLFPAFNSLRAAIEAIRLFRAFFLDKDFRNDYISNQNTDFRNTRDNGFVQSKVNSTLEKLERDLRAQDKIPLSINLFNNSLTKGSVISEMHSELSKWSHLLNINLLMPPQINGDRINMGICDELSTEMQLFIKKYLECVYIALGSHEEIFINVNFSKDFRDFSCEMVKKYQEYIRIFYK